MSVFSFTFGSEYHPSGLGAWQVTVDKSGMLTATHRKIGEEIDFGPFHLPMDENDHIWALILNLNITSYPPGFRMGVPDEVMYTFKLETDNHTQTAWMWAGDGRKIPVVLAVVVEMDRLIEQYTGQKAHLP
jgi:hypothetical protein